MATSFLLRKSYTIPGGISVTGNTLGLSDKNYPYQITRPLFTTFGYGAHDIGTFITTNTSLQESGYPSGTTKNWGLNSSSAILNLPQGASVVYAELLWGGETRSNGFDNLSSQNLDGSMNVPVKFTTPSGTVYNISPDPATYGQATVGHLPASSGLITVPYTGGDALYYIRSQDVTNIVKSAGTGKYTCAGVPAAINPMAPGGQRCCGWDLVVIYELASEPIKNLTLFIGIDAIGAGSITQINYFTGGFQQQIAPNQLAGPRQIDISGFVTPSSGPVAARLIMAAMGGDPLFRWAGIPNAIFGSGDRVNFGPTAASAVPLSGPNNLQTNFWASQINNNSGLLDTTGTKGDLNTNPPLGVLGEIKRQGWDITSLGASNILGNSQNSASVILNTEGDELAVHLIALEIPVNAPFISTVKSVNKEVANSGDTLLYTVVIKNSGTATATNVTFIDTIPNGTTFVPGSVSINGTPNSSAIPNAPGFKLPDIPPNGVVTVSFNVKVGNVLPTPNPIPNSALVNFNYVAAPGLPTQSGSSSSNTVNTLIDVPPVPALTTIKQVNTTSSVVGDKVLYTVTIINTGNTQLNNTIFIDTMPNGTSFVPGSLIINNVSSNLSPEAGVPLGNLSTGQQVVLNWYNSVNTIPNPNPFVNSGFVGYTYQTSTNPLTPGGVVTNTVATSVQQALPNVQIQKDVNKTSAAVGETVKYTVTFTNKGNITLYNLIFQDTLSNGLKFVPQSVLLSGGSQPTYNPEVGFIAIDTLPVGQSVIVQFSALITTIPTPNPIPNLAEVNYKFNPFPGSAPVTGEVTSNVVFTDVFEGINPVLTLNKEVNVTTANVGDILNYTVGISNNGNVDLYNILFKDTIPNGTSFVPGSMQLNYSSIAGNPQTGVPINFLPENGLAIVTFQVKVDQLPIPNPIPNVATASYNYVNVIGNTVPASTTSNQVTTLIKLPQPSTALTKDVDKNIAAIGETVTYTVRLTNTGGVTLNNIFFIDTIPNGLAFVPQSVSINGISNTSVNPQTGFTIGSLAAGEVAIIQFRGLVTTLPNPNPMLNVGNIIYEYTTNASNPNGNSGSILSNTVPTQVIKANINLSKLVDKVTANIGDTLTYTLIINNPNSIQLTNVISIDSIPIGTSFIQNSVIANGNPTSSNPQNGVNVGTLNPGANATITFQVTVVSIPPNGRIVNSHYTTSNYQPSPTSPISTNTGNSNEVLTVLSQQETGSGQVTKSVNLTQALVGQTISYTVNLINTGSLPLTNVIFTDTIQATNVTFIPGSLTINGTPNAGNPSNGLNIGNISVGGTSVITYQVTTNGLPVPNPVPNNSSMTYTYTPAGQNPVTSTTISNTVNTTITTPSGSGNTSVVKSVDKTQAQVGDTLTYTSVITNTGNLPLTNLIFTDALQATNISLVPGSVTVNGVSSSGDPATGINIGNLAVGSTATVIFRVTVTGTPVPNPIPNTSQDSYTYTPVGGSPTTGSNTSNQVNTLVSIPSGTGNTSILKAVDKTQAQVGDTLTYTSVITNTGSLPLTNVVFTDALQSTNTSFIPGTLNVNGTPNAGNPLSGVNIGNLAVGGVAIISFQVKVDGTPVPNPIPNTSQDSYTYTPPGGSPTTGNNTSNQVNTLVSIPSGTGNTSILKAVDKTQAQVGDTLTYTSVITNTGNLPLTNVIFTDALQSTNTSFVPGTLNINGIPNAGNPLTGVNVGNLSVGGIALVSFQVKVDGTPVPNPIANTSQDSYTYTPPGGSPTTGSNTSNQVNTLVSIPSGTGSTTIQKSVDKTQAQIGDTLTYTCVITNTGNLPLTNLIFTDTIQATNVSFIPGSVTVNGSANTGNPSSGVNIGNLPVGGNVIVTYKVTINGTPSPNPIPNTAQDSYTYTPAGGSPTTGSNISNQVNTQVNTPSEIGSSIITKQVDKGSANVGDTLNYTLTVTNTGNLPLNNVVVTDPITNSNVSFVPSSVTVNGISQPSANPNSGINIGNIPVGGNAIIKFSVVINGIPVPNPIQNVAVNNYTYTPTGGVSKPGTNTSNPAITTVNNPNGTGTAASSIVKSVDKTQGQIGDTLTYTSVITNTGNLPLNNMIFTDTIQATNVSFIPGSVTINGASNSGNPTTGINIGNVPVGASVSIVYKVTVNGIPQPNPIPNTSQNSYSFTPSGGSTTQSGNSSNTVFTLVSVPGGTGASSIIKTVDKSTAAVGDTLTYTSVITNTGDITLNNLIFVDQIEATNVSFIPGSVTVNGSSNLGNPALGILLGSLSPGSKLTIVYKVTVNGIPVPNPIPNVSSDNYTYTPVGGSTQTGGNNSNQVNTSVSTPSSMASTTIVKSVDKPNANVGDTLTYSATVTNNGNIALNNVVFKDPITSSNVSFVPGSVTVNGISNPGNPATGINVGNLPIGSSAIVMFKVVINGLPVPNPIQNTAVDEYSYTPPGGTLTSGTNTSNPTISTVNNPGPGGTGALSAIKSTDKTIANIGDEISYTAVITNTGTLTATNVIFTDKLPSSNISFVPGSVTVNGIPNAGNPSNGIAVGTLSPGASATIKFKIIVNGVPVPNPISNIGSVNFTYTPNGGTPQTSTTPTNPTNTVVPNNGTIATSNIIKSVDKTQAKVNDIIKYTSIITNTGNTPLTNVIFTDTIQASNISFVPGSVTINGISNSGNPQTGINIGNLPVGSSATVIFNATINGIPAPNPIPNTASNSYTYIPAGGSSTTGGNISNQVNTSVTVPDGKGETTILKTVNSTTANVGDTLTYTSVITNTGNLTLNNVIFTDAIQATNVSFIPGSVTVNGVPNGGNPQSGINLGNLAVNAIAIVVFKATINGLPAPNPIPNTSATSYTYTPIGGNPTSGSNTSNLVSTNVNQLSPQPITEIIKQVNKQIAGLGETLTYTLSATNTGTVAANNVIITDIPPTDTTFISNSVIVNGVNQPLSNPANGINIGTLNPGQTVVLSYSVKTPSDRIPNPILNTGGISYSYIPSPGGIPILINLTSNQVSTTINAAVINPGNNVTAPGITKSVDKPLAQIGDTLIYTINVKNSGNISTKTALLTDLIPTGTVFVPGSVTVDGLQRPSDNPSSGINLGAIQPGGTSIIQFRVTVISNTNNGLISNVANINYSYEPNPATGEIISNSSNSNTVNTTLAIPPISPTTGVKKSSDISYAKIGDVINYTVEVSNTGTLATSNVFFQDTIPAGTTFVSNSVYINGVNRPGVNPTTGFSIGNLAAGNTAIITYQLTVVDIPAQNPLINKANITYSYQPDPTKPPITTTVTSPNNTVQVNQANINTQGGGLNKTVDKTYAKVGDILTYTINLKNTGNVVASNVVLTDAIPSGTSFVSGSVTVNGVPSANSSPSLGIPIGSLNPSASSIITFKVTVITIPVVNPIPNKADVSYNYTTNPNNPNSESGKNSTNVVYTTINQGSINPTNGIIKTSDKQYASPGDVVTYTVVIKNTGNAVITNAVFQDTVPQGTSFIQNTFTINGGIIPGANPTAGVNIGSISANETKTIQFKVSIDTVPANNPISNIANVNYQFIVDPNTGTTSTGGVTSRPTTTTISNANIDPNNGGIVKSVNKTYSTIGDTLTYTIKVTNSGNVAAENVILYDTIPLGTTFISNSVTVDGASRPNQSPASGVSIGNISPNQTVIIAFNVKVTSIPSGNIISNAALIDYSYVVDPNKGTTIDKEAASNIVVTNLNNVVIDPNNNGITKTVDKTYVKLNDIVTYTININNTGNTAATNVIVKDTLPVGTEFIENSVLLNNVAITGVNPQTGIPVGTVNPNTPTIIKFSVKVVSIPNPNVLTNIANLTYNYTVNPNNPGSGSGNASTKPVTTTVNSADINNNDGGLIKSVDKAYASVGDIITYTISLKNTGNVSAQNVVLVDTIAKGTKLVQDSIQINGQNISGVDPNVGLQLGTIQPNGSVIIVYKVKVTDIPKPNPIPNSANVTYSFISNPTNPIPSTVTSSSNEVYTNVNSPNINTTNNSAVKTVDKSYAKVGDTLTYTITVTNKGNTTATNVVIIDPVPPGTQFMDNSVIVNGTTQPGANPALGVIVPDIMPGATTVISYKAKVTEVPVINPILNTAEVQYSFTLDPNKPNGERVTVPTNQTQTQVNSASISPNNGGLLKSVDKQYADIGDQITFTINVKNTGNVIANNVVIYDTIPNGTSYVVGSLRVNGIEQADNPQTGINIGAIAPGSTAVVSFKVLVTKLTTPNVVNNTAVVKYNFTTDPQSPNGETATNSSNSTQTVINSAMISPNNGSLLKQVDKEYASIGDVLTYTVTIVNTGNVAAENVIMIDTIPQGTSFVSGSVAVNGISQNSSNPQTGVPIGLIPVNGKAIVQFRVKVESIPVSNPIPNSALINYKYLVNPVSGIYKQNSTLSNIVKTQVNTANLSPEDGSATKSVDKKYVDIGDVVTYTITLQNKGNTPAINVLVKDTIPSNTTFINNSVTINGVVQIGSNPQNGISVSQVAPGETKLISFKVRVDSIPNPNVIKNIANIAYSYVVDPINQIQIDNNVNTNGVTVTVNSGQIDPNNGGFQKKVDKNYASLGDTVNYTIYVRNTGNVVVNNVIIQDTVPNGTSFVNNSILVNGIRRAGDNLTSGINLNSLLPGEESIITYSVVVTSIPKINPIPNDASVSYTYTVDPNKPNSISDSAITNTVLTQINYADISTNNGGIIKSVNGSYSDIGSRLVYTVLLKNTGNVDANNIVLYDTIPNGTQFVPNSVFINNVNIMGANPQNGVNVGILEPNKVSVVTFAVKVVSIPNNNKIPNQAVIDFTYTKDPNSPNGEFISNSSNVVTTTVSTGLITPGTTPIGPNGTPLPPTGGFIKTSDKSYVQVGDIINYKLQIKNSGNTPIKNVFVIDTLPSGITFVPDSLGIDGVTTSSDDITKGIIIPTIEDNQTKLITFKALVISIPDTNPIVNKGFLSYEYTVDPTKPPIKGSSTTNENNIFINSAVIRPEDGGFLKEVDKNYAELGDTLTYSIVVKNTGNVKANNVVIKDTIPEGTVFIPKTVSINGVYDNTLNPQTGIGILVLNPGATAVVSFQVKVTSLTYDAKIKNAATVSYDFILDPNKPLVNGSSVSNTVITKENTVNFSGDNFIKLVDTNYASKGDVIEYTFIIKNSGNIMASNVVFKDTIPDAMEFVEGSVVANGIKLVNADPQVGISLGTVGVNDTITISFNATIISIPNNKKVKNVGLLTYASQVDPNKDPVMSTTHSNLEDVYIIDPATTLTKSANSKTVVVGDIVTYTLIIADNGNVDINNIRVVDDLSPHLEFIDGSVVINGKDAPNENIISGIVLDMIKTGTKTTITFKAKVIDYPENGTLDNVANMNYSYQANPDEGMRGGNIDSNTIVLSVENAQVNVTKTSNVKFAKIDDVITYVVEFENVGTLEAKNIIFFDSISSGVAFVPGSFSVNGKKINSIDISRGVSIGNLKPGEKTIVKYSIVLNNVNNCNKLVNAAYGVFEYQVTNKGALVQKTTNVAELTIVTHSPNFKQMNIDGIINLAKNMPPIEEINEITAVIEITNYYVIDTIKGISAANSKLTGQKLVLNGFVHETVEYTAAVSNQSVHYTCESKKFSTFIVVDNTNLIGANIQIEPLIEDISYTKIGCRSIYTNITFNIDALINR